MNKGQGDNNNNNNFFNKNPLLVFAIFSVIVIMVFKSVFGDGQGDSSSFTNQSKRIQTIEYSQFKELIKNNQITDVGIGQNTIQAKAINGGIVYRIKKVHGDLKLLELLEEKKIPYGSLSENTWLMEFIFSWLLPIGIFFGIWFFLANKMQKNMGGGMLGMGRSNKLINSEKPNVKFEDVAGAEEAKEEVKEIVDFLKHPDRYIELGAKIPKGVLLVGPPGTGKTLLAKAVAGEANVPFLSVNGSSFIEMFVGVGASRVRDLFETAKKDAPAIIFIDEIDAIGKSRAAGGMGGNDEREQTLNQLLAEMDGFATNLPVIVLAATNRPEVLDAALLRPGRFDRQVLVDKPDFRGRVQILKVHIKDIKLAKDVHIEEIGRMTVGLAGADLANIINEAALLAGRADKKEVEQNDFIEAIERALIGLEKKSRRINEDEKRIVAYHESGHALLSEITRGANRLKKLTIIPRGLGALGYALQTPEENKFLHQYHELIAQIDVALGGRAAEEIFIGEVSTGASSDLDQATSVIKSMVEVYGMSDVAGLMVLSKQNNMFLGGGSTKDYSEQMAKDVDMYVKDLLNERYKSVLQTLKTYNGAIENMVKALYEEETIDGELVREIIRDYEIDNNLESRLVKRKDLKEIMRGKDEHND